jgi:hypothetical protein
MRVVGRLFVATSIVMLGCFRMVARGMRMVF